MSPIRIPCCLAQVCLAQLYALGALTEHADTTAVRSASRLGGAEHCCGRVRRVCVCAQRLTQLSMVMLGQQAVLDSRAGAG